MKKLLASMVEKWPELREALRESGSPRIIPIKIAGRIVLFRPDEIELVIARRTYAMICAASGKHRVRSSLSALQQKLPEGKFIRINRSTLVNVDHIKELLRKTHGDGLLRTHDGREFPLSRRYRDQWVSLISRGAA